MGSCSRALFSLIDISHCLCADTLQIAAQIREFVQSDESELVLASKLSAEEINAAHCLAAKEGLGYETRGDEGNRALHVWKVRITPRLWYESF